MRAPEFWAARDSLAARLLTPASVLFTAAARLRHMTTVPQAIGIPVICVGNLVAGGAGKTPVVLSLVERLSRRAAWRDRIHCVTRGYGGSARGPLRVDAARHDFRDVGDEALLLAAAAPTWVARDRVAGGRAAGDAGARIVVLDDGFQNPLLRKDFSLVVIDGGFGFGNGRVLPAGPLREPVSDGLARADAVVIVGEDSQGIAAEIGARPCLRATLEPNAGSRARLAGRRLFAFAGIGRPGKFFETLRALECDLAGTRDFPDHHPFTLAEVDQLVRAAQAAGAELVTTAKDAVRLPPAARTHVAVLDVSLAWHDEAALDRLLDPLIEAVRA